MTKVIAATNAAESSVTLPDVSLVVCLGGQKVVVCDERGTTRLMKTWISKASATQRAGRTARVAPGVVVRLYPKEALDQLPDHDAAEITRQPLEDLCSTCGRCCLKRRDSAICWTRRSSRRRRRRSSARCSR